MILLWGIATDPPMAALIDHLRERRRKFFVLDQDRIAETQVVTHGTSTVMQCGPDTLELSDVTSAYIRPFSPDQIPALADTTPDDPRRRHAEHFGEWMWAWADVTPARVFNRPSTMESNHSKPLQLALLQAHGFRTPETIVTNDPAAARRFCRRHGEVIYKSISSRRSIVARVTSDHRDRWADLPHCPTQFQRWIKGVDVRVHVVGVRAIACEIQAGDTDDDYRYAVAGAEVRPINLPAEMAERCRAVSAAAGLHFAGIDLRRTADGAWYAFEINPSPAFTFFGEPHARTVLNALTEAMEAGIPIGARGALTECDSTAASMVFVSLAKT